jgi:DNA-directed RNA polymerase specialized sigma24 family protein
MRAFSGRERPLACVSGDRRALSWAVKVTQLDQLLYAWLAQTDERKFDQAFQRYYAQASPHVVRYLARRSSLQDLDCEQIAVDALLKFFCRVGRDRREAAESILAALAQVQPLNLGPFHARHVERWTGEVGEFRQSSMSFTLAPTDDAGPAWKSEVQTQIDAIPPLQRQGVRLLESVRCATSDAPSTVPEESETVESAADLGVEYPRVRDFAARLGEAAGTESPASDSAEVRHPGVVRFVGGAWTVVEQLPTLRIPTNGYLFDIAQSLYLDECKARGRKKRGGAGVSTAEEGTGAPPGLSAFVLEDDDPETDHEDRGTGRAGVVFGPAEAVAVDPAEDPIDEDFCERFYEYLRKPLTDAEDAYARAAAAGKGTIERKRLDSVSAKHARLMSVLSMRIEGHTQEAIAEALDLSRNQVKYMAEQVQEAYRHFCAAAMSV